MNNVLYMLQITREGQIRALHLAYVQVIIAAAMVCLLSVVAWQQRKILKLQRQHTQNVKAVGEAVVNVKTACDNLVPVLPGFEQRLSAVERSLGIVPPESREEPPTQVVQ